MKVVVGRPVATAVLVAGLLGACSGSDTITDLGDLEAQMVAAQKGTSAGIRGPGRQVSR